MTRSVAREHCCENRQLCGELTGQRGANACV